MRARVVGADARAPHAMLCSRLEKPKGFVDFPDGFVVPWPYLEVALACARRRRNLSASPRFLIGREAALLPAAGF